MRTTITMDDDLLAEVKSVAARTNRTLSAVIEDAVRELLARRDAPRHPAPIQLPTFRGNGLRPGIDLDDSAGLLDVMEGRA